MTIIQSRAVTLPVVLMLGLFMLSGCSSKKQPKLLKSEVLPIVDISKKEKFTKRLGLGNPDIGGWLDPYERGGLFKPAKRQHPDSAIVYFYRPNTRWSQQEVVGASIFLNEQRLKGLKNNHYYWVELPPGDYRLAVRRPLPPVFILKGKVVDFTVKAGQDYYLKYAEQYHVAPPDPALGLLFERPIIQMPTDKALEEIVGTRLKTHPFIFTGDNPNQLAGLTLPTVSGGSYKAIDKSVRLSKATETNVGVEFKIYNPLTW